MLTSITTIIFSLILATPLSAVLTEQQQQRVDDLKEHFVTLNAIKATNLPDGLDSEKVNSLFLELLGIPSIEDATEVDKALDKISTESHFQQLPSEVTTDAKEESIEKKSYFYVEQEEIIPQAEPVSTWEKPNPSHPEVIKNMKAGTRERIRINTLMSQGLSDFHSAMLDQISNDLMPLEDLSTKFNPEHVRIGIHNIKCRIDLLKNAYSKLENPLDITHNLNSAQELSYDKTIAMLASRPHPECYNLYVLAYRGEFAILRHVLPGAMTWRSEFGNATQASIVTSHYIVNNSLTGVTDKMKELVRYEVYCKNSNTQRKVIDGNNYYMYHMFTPAGWFTPVDLKTLTSQMVINAENLGVAKRKPTNLLYSNPSYGLFLKGTKTQLDGTTTTWTQFFADGDQLKLEHTNHDGSPVTLIQGFYGTGSDFNDLGGITSTKHEEFIGTKYEFTVPKFSSLWWYTDRERAHNTYVKKYLNVVKEAREFKRGDLLLQKH